MRISDWSSDVCSSDLPLDVTTFILGSIGANAGSIGGRNASIRRRMADGGAISWRWTCIGWALWAKSAGGGEIGRAACRERGCQHVSSTVGAAFLDNTTYHVYSMRPSRCIYSNIQHSIHT